MHVEMSGVFVRQGIGYIQPGYFAVLRKESNGMAQRGRGILNS